MQKKLNGHEVTHLLHVMGSVLWSPQGIKYEAETVFDQTRLDTALRVLTLAMAGKSLEKPAPPQLTAIPGGKAD